MAAPTGAADSPPARAEGAEGAATNQDALKAFVIETPRNALFGVNCSWDNDDDTAPKFDDVANLEVENRLLFLANMEGIKPPFHERETIVCLHATCGPEGMNGYFLRFPLSMANNMLDQAPPIYEHFFATNVDQKIRVRVETSDGRVRLHPFGLGLAPAALIFRKMARHARTYRGSDEFYKLVSFSKLRSSRTWAQVKVDPGFKRLQDRLQVLQVEQGLPLGFNNKPTKGPEKVDGNQ